MIIRPNTNMAFGMPPAIASASLSDAGDGGGGGGGGSEIAFAQFADGVYRKNGASAVLSDIFENNAIWGSFDSASVVNGSGLIAGVDTAQNASLKSDICASMMPSGFTVVGKLAAGISQSNFLIAQAYDSPDYSQNVFCYFSSVDIGIGSECYIAWNDGATEHEEVLPKFSNGDPHNFAMTISADGISISIDGGAVVSVPAPSAPIYTAFGIFLQGVTMTEVSFLTKNADADLPALSAIA